MKETRKPVRKPRTPAVTRLAAGPAPAKAKPAVSKKAAKGLPQTRPSPGDDREEWVRVAAYFRAQRRGFVPGYEIEDWLAAEAEVSAVTPSPHGTRQPTGPRRRARTGKV